MAEASGQRLSTWVDAAAALIDEVHDIVAARAPALESQQDHLECVGNKVAELRKGKGSEHCKAQDGHREKHSWLSAPGHA